MRIVSDSHVGKRRPNNEDSVKSIQIADKVHLLMVADGVGGEKKGEVASAQTIDLVEKYFAEHQAQFLEHLHDEEQTIRFFKEAIEHANQQVAKQAMTEEFYMMATTLVAALIIENKVVVANVGDSRCYRYETKEKSLQLITKDHTYVQQLVDVGVISEQEARVHADKHQITRAIGLDTQLRIDHYILTLEKNDIVLLCSDGLNGMLEDAEIKMIIQKGKKLEKIVESLIHKALEKGGVDNITVLCAIYEKGGE